MSDRGRNAILVVSLKVDDPVHPLVPTAAMASGDKALIIPAARLLERLGQALLGLLVLIRQLGEIADRGVAPAGAGRLVVADTHREGVLLRLRASGGQQPAPNERSRPGVTAGVKPNNQ